MFVEERAAFTFRNDLDEVIEVGIEVVLERHVLKNFDGVLLELEEINLRNWTGF